MLPGEIPIHERLSGFMSTMVLLVKLTPTVDVSVSFTCPWTVMIAISIRVMDVIVLWTEFNILIIVPTITY